MAHFPRRELALALALLISSALAASEERVLRLTKLPESCREPYPFKGCDVKLGWRFEACGVYRGEPCAAFCRALVPGAPPCPQRWYWSASAVDTLYTNCMRRCLALGQTAAGCGAPQCFAQRPMYIFDEGALLCLALDRGMRVRSHSARFRLSMEMAFNRKVNCFFVCWRRARCPQACRRGGRCCRR